MLRILLVDDDPIDTFVTQSLLSKCDIAHTLSVTTNGLDALKHIQENADRPHIILLDLNMPYVNGFEFLELIKTIDVPLPEDVIIIVLTLHYDSEGATRALASGAHSVLTKPLDLDKLKAILKR